MDDLFAARSQMALSLAFHMIFATYGIGLPVLMVLADALALRTGDGGWTTLAERWAKGTAILFAVGAVSGTVLSFELGLLWPGFMGAAGPVIGLPFTMEGFAFFFEAIFLGIYLYGRGRVPPLAHLATGVGVAASGALSAAFVVCANAFMNTPAGYTLDANGRLLTVDPWAAMFNPSAGAQVAHMLVAAWLATGWSVAGIHAWYLRQDVTNRFHRRGLALGLAVGIAMTAVQPITGHWIAANLSALQPTKLAALEAHWETTSHAPFTLGGWPDEEAEATRWGIEVPGMLSVLATGHVDGVVKGLSDVPPDERPPVAVAHLAYQVMLASMAVCVGSAAAALWGAFRARGVPTHRALLGWLAFSAPTSMIGIEAGWIATEVGRQPWVVVGWLRTADTVTPMPGLAVPFLTFTLLYAFLGVMTVALLRRQFHHAPVSAVAR